MPLQNKSFYQEPPPPHDETGFESIRLRFRAKSARSFTHCLTHNAGIVLCPVPNRTFRLLIHTGYAWQWCHSMLSIQLWLITRKTEYSVNSPKNSMYCIIFLIKRLNTLTYIQFLSIYAIERCMLRHFMSIQNTFIL